MAIATDHSDVLKTWFKKMQEEGLLPKKVVRLIIDIPLEDCVTVYTQSINTEGLFNDDLIEVLRGAELVVDGKKKGT